jgi:hypothetical protein
MLVLNQSQFNKVLEKGEKALLNAYVYILSHDVENEDGVGNDNFVSLFPSKEQVEAVVSGDLDKKTFLKQYKKSLKSYQNRFLLYTIARSFNEKKYMPIFVSSDAEYELGYMKVLSKFLQKEFGMKQVKVKEWLKAVKVVTKEAKGVKKNKREKAMAKGLRDFVKDTSQISLKGLEKLEAADQEFAIDRIALVINQSEDVMDEIKKQAIADSIDAFSKTKKGKKLVKKHAEELDLSKKRERWSKKDMINLVLAIYNDIHDVEDND